MFYDDERDSQIVIAFLFVRIVARILVTGEERRAGEYTSVEAVASLLVNGFLIWCVWRGNQP